MGVRFRWFIAASVVLGVLATCALADDINPPWWRNLAGTTFAKWEYGTADLRPAPDAVFNPNGVPITDIFPGHPWYREYGGRLGVWPLSGLIVIDIPNYGPPNPYKLVWVQITWTSESPYAEPVVDELLFKGRGELVQRVQVGPVGAAPWWHDTYLLKIVPNPTREVLRIQGAIWVDEVVVDTYCVPEPSTTAALGSMLGLLGFAFRRRR